MPDRLTLRERLVDFEGRPTRLAMLAFAAVALALFLAGFALRPGGEDAPAAPVTADKLMRDAAPAPKSGKVPKLSKVAGVPVRRAEARKPKRRRAARPAPVAATPQPSTTPEPSVTVAPVAPVTAAPAPAPSRPAPAPSKPAPAKPSPPAGNQGFDSTG